MKLTEVIQFVDFLSAFPRIKRSNKIKGKTDFENDAEHSYQLAMVVWYLADAMNIQVNRQLLLEYALAHDLVEIYAGDVDTFLKNSEDDQQVKKRKETDAFGHIKKDFPQFVSLHGSIERFEHLVDTESKLVYIVDKMLPDINIFLSNDTYYKDNKVTYEDWQQWVKSKIEKSGVDDEEVLALVNQLGEFQKSKKVFFE